MHSIPDVCKTIFLVLKYWSVISLFCPLGRAKRCQYQGKKYPQGATIERALKPDYERCDRCMCIGRKFRNCTTIFFCENGYLNCGKEDYEFPPGACCPVCKRESENTDSFSSYLG